MSNIVLNKETYPVQPIYSNGKFKSHNFFSVCVKAPRLMINRNYLKRNYTTNNIDETIFNEIRQLSPFEKINPDFRHLLEPIPKFKGPIQEFVSLLKAALKNYIIKIWDNKKPVLVSHSSGFDSRILSGILMELREERGEEWLGDIHFRCHQPEELSFFEIMKRQKWDESQYSVWRGPPEDHFDLGNPLVDVNGFTEYVVGMNYWNDIIPFGNEHNYRILSGMGGGEFLNYPARKKPLIDKIWSRNTVFNRYLNFLRRGGAFIGHWQNLFDSVILPYYSYSFLEIGLRIRDEFHQIIPDKMNPHSLDLLRYGILKTMDVDLINIVNIGHDYNFKISLKRKREMLEHWKNSMLYQDYYHIQSIRDVDPLNRECKFDSSMYGFVSVYQNIQNARLQRINKKIGEEHMQQPIARAMSYPS